MQLYCSLPAGTSRTSSMATTNPPKRKAKRYYEEEDGKDEPKTKNAASDAVKRGGDPGQWKKKNVVSGAVKRFHKGGDEKMRQRPNQGQWKNNQKKKGLISGADDPFPGLPSVPSDQLSRYERARKAETDKQTLPAVRQHMKVEESKVQSALSQAAKHDLLLPEEQGFLEGDEGEDTSTVTQQDITEAVDITSASKHFNLNLNQFGPYRINYSRNGRHLLLAGQRGHVASMDWHTKTLGCEMNVMETVNDVRWLHTHSMFAVAQKKWLYIYDHLGVELHCIKKFNDVLRMEFLPYHFLLATCSAPGFLQYLDVSIGKEIAATCVKSGRLNVMCQNPHNAVIHLGHHNGTVTLWSPTVKEPLVKMLCHRGAVRALSVDKTGMYMASSGTDRKLTIFDLRTYKPLTSCFLPLGAGSLCHSQRGLLAAGVGNVVQVYKDAHITTPRSPYMCLSVKAPIHGLQFCPYEDVLGIGHGGGFTSMIVPGAGEANFDGLECNPYETKKQRQEWEVKALLEKIQPELITLDPTRLVEVDAITMEQKRKDQVERMVCLRFPNQGASSCCKTTTPSMLGVVVLQQLKGFDPWEKTRFTPRRKLKGRSSTGSLLKRKKKVAHEEKRKTIQQSLAKKAKAEKSNTDKVPQGQRSTLDRFKK